MKAILSLLLLIGVAVAGGAYYLKYVAVDPPPNFREATVQRGELTATITATGTIEPEEVVDVGAQVAGRIKEFGKDPADPEKKKSIDYGSVVQDGTVLAYIDDSLYRAQVDQASASLLRAKADLGQATAKLLQAAQDRKRADQLREANTRLRQGDNTLRVISDSDYDLAVANHTVAQANVEVAQAAVKQAEAALCQARTNLDYTVIKSPVQGVIIDRRVNVGQTVVASLSAPSLFLIAKDLRRMQVWASVNEADIGRIHVGLPVRFTVDAFPEEVFQGTVAQTRLNATMTQNVVTYTVVIAFDNSQLKLKPYLTANVRFEIEKRSGVLLVPNMALRWKPRAQLQAPEAGASLYGRSSERAASKRSAGQSSSAKAPRPADDRNRSGSIWVRQGNFVRPIEVQVGLSDGTQTEVAGEGVRDGLPIIVGEIRVAEDAGTTNPFTPKLGRSKPQSKGR